MTVNTKIDEIFMEAICDDLNTPAAIARMDQLAKLANKSKDKKDQKKYALELYKCGRFLGLFNHTYEEWRKKDYESNSARKAFREEIMKTEGAKKKLRQLENDINHTMLSAVLGKMDVSTATAQLNSQIDEKEKATRKEIAENKTWFDEAMKKLEKLIKICKKKDKRQCNGRYACDMNTWVSVMGDDGMFTVLNKLYNMDLIEVLGILYDNDEWDTISSARERYLNKENGSIYFCKKGDGLKQLLFD